jgi:hypothetical protein
VVAKLAIHVCPVPGCVTIAAKAGACPTHPNKALVREVYEHKPKLGAPKPGDLGGKKPFDFAGLDGMGDILNNLFGSARPS